MATGLGNIALDAAQPLVNPQGVPGSFVNLSDVQRRFIRYNSVGLSRKNGERLFQAGA